MFAILIQEANRAKIEAYVEENENGIHVAEQYYTSEKWWYYISGMTFPFSEPFIGDTILPEYRFNKIFKTGLGNTDDWNMIFPQ